MKDGYSGKFDFSLGGKFEYHDTGLGSFNEFKYKPDKRQFDSLSFLTTEVYENEVLPALTSWLEEKVQNEPFGGLYRADFMLQIIIGDENAGYIRDYIFVSDPKRKKTQREMIRALVQDKTYETMDVKSKDYNNVIKDILRTIPTLLGELPTDILKDAIATISKKYKEADSWYFSNAVQYPLVAACTSRLQKRVVTDYELGDWIWTLTDEDISVEELDFLCWIALQIIRNADDSDMRDNGESILNLVSQKGFGKAKDYLKFGTGEIGKEYTHLKTAKFEAVANDIKRIIDFKVKVEDAESYGAMLDFIMKLLKQGFPTDYQIKINSKLKNYIPVSGLNKKSKTNLFFGNAATFPELWDKMMEYARNIFDEYTYYSDSTDEEAVTVGGYAVYALGTADLKANAEFVNEFLEKVDFEHDLTARSFVDEYMDKKTAQKYGLD